MTTRRNTMGLIAGAVMALGFGSPASAADFEFNLQSFLPAQATIPSKIIDVWADSVEASSDGAIKINRFPSMQLGGKPPQLIDQVIDGAIDITWNVVGYTPGRFPSTEVFELPFMVNDARAASAAFWKMMEADIADREFSDVKMLGSWVHGPGVIHSNKASDHTVGFQRNENTGRLSSGKRTAQTAWCNAGWYAGSCGSRGFVERCH